MRELVGEYIVDMYPANGRVYYTVTRKGTAELLAIGDEATREEALEQAKLAIREFGSSDSKAQSA
jgi:hypothetical protein